MCCGFAVFLLCFCCVLAVCGVLWCFILRSKVCIFVLVLLACGVFFRKYGVCLLCFCCGFAVCVLCVGSVMLYMALESLYFVCGSYLRVVSFL